MSRILLLFIIGAFVLLFFFFEYWHIPRIFWFVTLGLSTGLYYGRFNNEIFHYPHIDPETKKYYSIFLLKNGSSKKVYAPDPNDHAKINTLWVHLVCGFIGSISMYMVFSRICLFALFIDWPDFILLLIGILGYTGLLPRTLWFFASKGDFPSHR